MTHSKKEFEQAISVDGQELIKIIIIMSNIKPWYL